MKTQKTEKKKCKTLSQRGIISRQQWDDLGRLAKAPKQALMVKAGKDNITIPDYRAAPLVNSGYAAYIMKKQIIIITPAGQTLVSSHGLGGQTADPRQLQK